MYHYPATPPSYIPYTYYVPPTQRRPNEGQRPLMDNNLQSMPDGGSSMMPPDMDMGVGVLSQHIEPRKEVKNHPTISQDWTNKDKVDRNRLIALQANMQRVSDTENGGRTAEKRTESGVGEPLNDLRTLRSEEPKPPPLPPPRKIRLSRDTYSSFNQDDMEARARASARERAAVQARRQQQVVQSQQSFANNSPVSARYPQEGGSLSDYSSSEGEENHLRSPTHEDYRSKTPEDPPQNLNTTERRLDGLKERPSYLRQLHGHDKKFPFSRPQSNDPHKAHENGCSGLGQDWKPNGSSKTGWQTGSGVKVPFSRQVPNDNSCQPPEALTQLHKKRKISLDPPGSNENTLIHRLRTELEALKKEKLHFGTQLQKPFARLQVVYRVSRSRDQPIYDQGVPDMYLDMPQLMVGDRDMASLQGRLPITNMESYLDRHPEVAFIVFHDTSDRYSKIEAEDERSKDSWSESINVTSRSLMTTLQKLMKRVSFSSGRRVGFDIAGSRPSLLAPYLPFYHHLEELRTYATDLPLEALYEWRLLVDYIEQTYGDEYITVRKMLESGTISRSFVPYLIKDGDTIVRRDSQDRSAYMATSQPTLRLPKKNHAVKDWNTFLNRQSGFEGSLCPQNLDDTVEEENPDSAFETQVWDIDTEFWGFYGKFQKCHGTVTLKIRGRLDEVISINDLEIYPIQFAEPELVKNMRKTGLEFWKSRSRRYVSYRSERAENDTKSIEPRYMIDPATYGKLHKKDTPERPVRDDLGPRLMSAKEPPPDPFLLLLPHTMKGFNMQNKKWEELEVSRISEVSWNKDAFESLVVEPTTKTLIKALVMQQLEGEKGTDLIAGKGQGLIVLLHGGPGTGKTFTAETVAELAEKPLYRVTCGDLGTEPTEVEKYLDSVLYLGKIWDCVVLLDEADVYLEERSIESLSRNALVSVFLRVLEYYEGILILTSNRVGTFDESFKSRIQLALHYEKLKFNDRRTIWENFIRRLHKVEETGIDFDDINNHIGDLARNELNGRQIRNAITTARQFARYQKKELNCADLQQVIKIALKFDRHTTEMQGGMTDDDRKREDGIRP